MTRMGKRVRIAQDVVSATKERIHTIYDQFDTVVVSMSGGKDSTVALNMTLEVARERGALPLKVLFFDEELVPAPIVEFLERLAASPEIEMLWVCVPMKYQLVAGNGFNYWYPWDPDKRDEWVREIPPGAITALPGIDPWNNPEHRGGTGDMVPAMFIPERDGRVVQMMGVRADESMQRSRIILAERENEHYVVRHKSAIDGGVTMDRGNLYKAYPIYDWSVNDIWRGINRFGWDYSTFYDRLTQMGVAPSHQRYAAPFGPDGAHYLWVWKQGFPEFWSKIIKRLPQGNTMELYGDSELYGHGGEYQLKPGQSWEDLIQELLLQLDMAIRPAVAKIVYDHILDHYNKTSDPILPTAYHPYTGIAWTYLCRLISRGDYRGRYQPRRPGNQAQRDAMKAAYDKQLREVMT